MVTTMSALQKIRIVSIIFLLSLLGVDSFAMKYHPLNLSLTHDHVLPRYRDLTQSTTQLSDATKSYCQAPDEKKLVDLQQSFHTAFDDWMRIQHIRFGPINEDSRYYKLQFWPDKHGVVRKHIKNFLNHMETENASLENLQSGSVAIQGFPAAEQLLFSEANPLLPSTSDFPQRCQLLQWVSITLAKTTQTIHQIWDDKAGFQNVIETAPAGNDDYLSDKEVSQEFLTNLQTGLKFVDESKLLDPLGKSEKKPRPKRAESWRSQRSLRNILINLQALQHLYSGKEDAYFEQMIKAENGELANSLQDHFQTAIQLAESVTIPLSQAVKDPTQRPKVVQLQQTIKDLRHLVEKQLTKATDINLGFNSLDGD